MLRIFISLLFLAGHALYAQDTLVLISGKIIVVSSVSIDENSIAYRKIKPGSKLKKITIDRVFAVNYSDGNEKVVFQTDSLDPLDFTVDQMRNFIKGEQDARRIYHKHYAKVGGLIVGGASSYYAFYGIIGPPIYASIVQLFNPNVEKILTFNVSGEAASTLGISSGSYVNNVMGTKSSPVVLKDQKLKIANKRFNFTQDAGIEDVVRIINERKRCTGVQAENVEGKLMLKKTDSAALLTNPDYREGFEKRVRNYNIRSAWISGLVGLVAGGLTLALVANN